MERQNGKSDLLSRVDCAMKRKKCELVIKNARVFNVFTGGTESGELAIDGGVIVAVGKGYEGKREYDANGLFALPAFIDSHIHVESTMLSPEEFALAAVPHGTGAIIADPHEIVNVCGIAGAEYMAEAFSRLNKDGVSPIDAYLQLPSCVPATPFETSGAVIDARETERELNRDLFFGLGEMMNYPGVINGDGETLRKIQAALEKGKPIDGHAPALTGAALSAYAGTGMKTDHECMNVEECREKVARGLYVQLRNGSSAHNLANAKAIDGYNYRRFLLCSDDRTALDLVEQGEIDDALRRLVGSGVPAAYAIAAATLNAAECYNLKGKGALAPSYDADLVLVEDLVSFRVEAVFKRGVLMAENGKALFSASQYLPDAVKGSVKIKPVSEQDFQMNLNGAVRAIRVLPKSVVTKAEEVRVEAKEGNVVLPQGVCKLAVVERHFASGNLAKCLLIGYGLRGGAVGITVSHDSHNLVVAGDNNAAMARVVKLLEEAGGGMAVVGGEGEEVFPLEIAGLMSVCSAEETARRTAELEAKARNMGVKEEIEPFMSLAFLSLAVIPKLRLTDRGLVDVERFEFVPVEVKK